VAKRAEFSLNRNFHSNAQRITECRRSRFRVACQHKIYLKYSRQSSSAPHQVGEWTGNTKAQVEGAAQQVKGNAENAWGKAKDAARDATDHAKSEHKRPKDIEQEQPESHEDRNVA
jgi:uncharacterized protein YjbJ (UPF0337 family)